MKPGNTRRFSAGSMKAPVRTSILSAILVALSVFAAAQTVQQNTTGRNPGTQVPPGPYVPDELTAAEQTRLHSRSQIGAAGVSAPSFKFGEYNGLNKFHAFAIGNFDMRGGAAYDSTDTWQWRFQGSSLGLETRNGILDFGRQGKFHFRFAYNTILANTSDSYQTPFLGVGTDTLTLPSSWIVPILPQKSATALNYFALDPTAAGGSVYNTHGVLTPPTQAQLDTMAAIRAADLPAFRNVDLSLTRKRGEAQFLFTPTETIDIPVGVSHEHKDGLRTLGGVVDKNTQDPAILPYRVNWDTDQASAAVNVKHNKLFLSFAYYGSRFNNNTEHMIWTDPAIIGYTTALSEEPNNQFHQFTATGSYKLSRDAKLLLVGSIGRGTQNQAYINPGLVGDGALQFGLPRPSLNGLVYTGMGAGKFTLKHGKWDLVADARFDERDNQSPVDIYLFQDNAAPKTGTSPFSGLYGLPTGLGSNTNIYNNRSLDKISYKAGAEAEYSFTKSEHLMFGYGWDRADRHCSYSWITCADAKQVNENTFRTEWRKSKGAMTARLEYAFSERRGDYNENAFLAETPMANQVPKGATTSVYAFMKANGITGYGPVAGLPSSPLTGDAAIFIPNNNVVAQAQYGTRNLLAEIPGFRKYYVADRNRNDARAQLLWLAKDKFAVEVSGEGSDDDYLNTQYGLKRRDWWAATMDVSYTASEDLVADVFYTYDNQRMYATGDAFGSNTTATFQGQAGNTVVGGPCFSTVQARNASAKIDPCMIWSHNDRDKIDTAGLTLRRKNLADRKLELAAELVYTRGRTENAAVGGSYVNNPLALAAPAAPPLPSGTQAIFFIPAQNYPVVRNDEIMVKPSATYVISKSASLQGFYWFQRLSAADWRYQALQFGNKLNFTPTNETVPNYDVQVGGLSLNWTF